MHQKVFEKGVRGCKYNRGDEPVQSTLQTCKEFPQRNLFVLLICGNSKI